MHRLVIATHKKPSSRSQILPMEIGRGLNRDVFAIKRAPDYSPTLNISSLRFRSLHIACNLLAALRPIFTYRKAHLKA